MHSDPKLLERLAVILDGHGLEQRYMFGGIGFFLNGNMCLGVWHNDLIARVGEDAASHYATVEEHARLMDLTGRPMRAWLQIEPPGCETDVQIKDWCDLAIEFVSTLPKKPKAPKKKEPTASRK